jgi:hypothetical protein
MSREVVAVCNRTTPQMIVSVGISFNLIIVRVKQGVAIGDTEPGLCCNTVPLRFVTVPPTQDMVADGSMEVVITTTIGKEQDQEDVSCRKSQLPWEPHPGHAEGALRA